MTMTGFKDYTKPVNDQMRTVSNVEPLPVVLSGAPTSAGAVWGPDAVNIASTRPSIQLGAVYTPGAMPVYSGGKSDLQTDGAGSLRVRIATTNTSASDTASNTAMISFASAAAEAQSISYVGTFNFCYNGSTWSRSRSVLAANNSQAIGTVASDMPLWSTSDLLGNVVNLTLGGDNTVIAGVGGQTIRVHRLYLSSLLATDIIIKDGAGTALTGTIHLNPGDLFLLDFSGRPWFKTSVGNAFIIYSSVATTIGGRVEYAQSA